MSAQLLQLLAQLDRPGATELVIATGRPVAIRLNGTYQSLTAAPVTLPQLLHLLRETTLPGAVPTADEVGELIAIDFGGRALRAQFIRQGADLMLRLEARSPSLPPPRLRAQPLPMRT